MPPRTTAFLYCLLAYLTAAWLAIGVAYLLQDQPTWLMLLAADVAATVLIFAYSVFFRNASMYDPYWSVIPIWIVSFLWAFPEGNVNSSRALLAGICVILWGCRLTWNWARGWQGLGHEDWRYRQLREQTGRWYPLVNFSGIHLFPTLIVFLGCLPLFPALSSSAAPLGWLDLLALVVTLGSIGIETLADRQLHHFRTQNHDPQALLESGLWRYSRHPNYLGEIGFWLGVCLWGLAAAPNEWWRGIGFVAMVLLFSGISIPMIDRRMLARRPAYAARMQRVSRLLLLPPRQAQ